VPTFIVCRYRSAGCGLVGLMLAAAGAEVVMTDREEDVLIQLDKNVRANPNLKGSAIVRKLSWGNAYLETHANKQEEFGNFDIVLGADIIYGESLNVQYCHVILQLRVV
jgi:predicted nicotinamide N-methyase